MRPVALVTGASRRLGRAFAEGAARAGHDVAVHFRSDPAAAAETTDSLRALGARAEAFRADFLTPGAAERLVREARNYPDGTKYWRGEKGRKYVRRLSLRENLTNDKLFIYDKLGYTPHRLAYRFAGTRRHRLPSDRVPVTLTAGDHRLLVKVGQSARLTLPFDPAVVEGGDEGRPVLETDGDTPFKQAVREFTSAVLEGLKMPEMRGALMHHLFNFQ